MQQQKILFLGLGILTIAIGYGVYFFYGKLGNDEESAPPPKDAEGGGGSVWSFLFLLVLLLAFAFNYLYSLLGPWDPLGIYQRNRTVIGIDV